MVMKSVDSHKSSGLITESLDSEKIHGIDFESVDWKRNPRIQPMKSRD